MRRVLMVTPHFPPDSSAASHRAGPPDPAPLCSSRIDRRARGHSRNGDRCRSRSGRAGSGRRWPNRPGGWCAIPASHFSKAGGRNAGSARGSAARTSARNCPRPSRTGRPIPSAPHAIWPRIGPPATPLPGRQVPPGRHVRLWRRSPRCHSPATGRNGRKCPPAAWTQPDSRDA